MKSITVPLESGANMTFFIGTCHLAVVENLKAPNTCRIVDGIHNNGGWAINLSAKRVVKLINDAVTS